ncbi:hypothetical protein Tco_0373642 [Tanacetum coccineum]
MRLLTMKLNRPPNGEEPDDEFMSDEDGVPETIFGSSSLVPNHRDEDKDAAHSDDHLGINLTLLKNKNGAIILYLLSKCGGSVLGCHGGDSFVVDKVMAINEYVLSESLEASGGIIGIWVDSIDMDRGVFDDDTVFSDLELKHKLLNVMDGEIDKSMDAKFQFNGFSDDKFDWECIHSWLPRFLPMIDTVIADLFSDTQIPLYVVEENFSWQFILDEILLWCILAIVVSNKEIPLAPISLYLNHGISSIYLSTRGGRRGIVQRRYGGENTLCKLRLGDDDFIKLRSRLSKWKVEDFIETSGRIEGFVFWFAMVTSGVKEITIGELRKTIVYDSSLIRFAEDITIESSTFVGCSAQRRKMVCHVLLQLGFGSAWSSSHMQMVGA